MKKHTLLYLFFFAALFVGCKKYLDLPPKNQRAVETIEDVKSVFAGYLDGVKTKFVQPIIGPFPLITANQIMMFEAYSDNINFAANMPKFVNPMNMHATEEFYANYLLWNPFDKYDVPGEIWNKYYEVIGFLNALIDQVGQIKDGTTAEKEQLSGEMKVHRAFFFFKLLQYFAPYEKAELGIPVYLHSGDEVVGIPMPRKPQIDVYRVILDDLLSALEAVQRSMPDNSYNVFYNERYINNLLAQVYWFKAESAAKEESDYTNTKKYSQEAVKNVIDRIPKTSAAINLTAQGTNLDYPAFFQTGSMYGEVAAFYGSTWDYIGFQPAGVVVNSDLYELFSDDDIRKASYFTGNAINSMWPDGVLYGPKYAHYYLFQPEEAYLILAEAQYRLGETEPARVTLNQFKGFRNAGNADGLSGERLLEEIINERRKEFFSNSDKRWLDLKRYGNKTITRSLRFFNKDYEVSVEPKGYRYALPIPLSELQENPAIVQNEGWVPIIF